MAPTEDDIRAEVRAWLADTWDPERPLADWRSDLADSGWGCPTWPREWYGRGLSPELGRVVAEELRAAGAVGPAIGVGMTLAAPTLLAHAPDELKARLLRRIVTGEDTWCQLFSEPGNGSDLAGLTTHARRDGDEWVVTGQKVWTTGAHHAAYGMLLARTDWDAPKHRGISFFAFPMRQPGVEVRPLRQMNGRASFNEVFLDEARVPHANLVGELQGGWAVALTTLAHERGLTTGLFGGLPPAGGGRTREEAAAEAASYLKTYEWYPQRAGRADLVPVRAQAHGRTDDPLVRQLVADLHATERTARLTADRGAGDAGGGGARPHRRRPRDAHRPRLARGRGHRRGARVGARGVDRRRHRRDPAQHHRRARARAAEGAVGRRRRALPRGEGQPQVTEGDR